MMRKNVAEFVAYIGNVTFFRSNDKQKNDRSLFNSVDKVLLAMDCQSCPRYPPMIRRLARSFNSVVRYDRLKSFLTLGILADANGRFWPGADIFNVNPL